MAFHQAERRNLPVRWGWGMKCPRTCPKIKATKPSIGQVVYMDFFVKAPLLLNAHGIPQQQHPDHQFWINRGTILNAVEWGQKSSNVREVKIPIYLPQQMIYRNMAFDTGPVKQLSLRNLSWSHHLPDPLISWIN